MICFNFKKLLYYHLRDNLCQIFSTDGQTAAFRIHFVNGISGGVFKIDTVALSGWVLIHEPSTLGCFLGYSALFCYHLKCIKTGLYCLSNHC